MEMVMMNHAACTSSWEPIGHSVTPTVPFPSDHGAVSEYEILNLPYKPHSDFQPTETLEDEVVPLCRAPLPWKLSSTFGILSDPTLCVTPEKSRESGPVNTMSSCSASEKILRPSSPGVYHPDPALALTPELSVKTVSKTADARWKEKDRKCKAALKSNLCVNKNRLENRDDVKLKQKVRFDIDTSESMESDLENYYPEMSISKSPSKIYQPLLYSDSKDGDDNQNTNMFDFTDTSRTIKYRVYNSNEDHTSRKKTDGFCSVKDMSDQIKMDSHVTGTTGIPSTSELDENVKPRTVTYRTSTESRSIREPITTVPSQHDGGISVSSKPKRKVVVTREFEERPPIEDYQFPFSDDDSISAVADIDGECEHVFARPEYNRTLKLATELRVVKESRPDVVTVLHKTLSNSEEKRAEINEKAASKVNIPWDQLSGLVSVEVPADEICQVEKEISQKAKIVKQKVSSKPKPQKNEREPDLLEFFTPDLQRELPDFSQPGLTKPKTHLTTASHDSAFDLYRHNRVWEGIVRK
ncbi:uncharacterized protein LOC121390119 [Gigantopelta aegis]|uniref:uncharacterized protein LOC121390119 n=1 Tax=Gigantopelta aegis TaxID=1735272 RepID=UPI001B889724|nr:uncharacterized protein LOC121390119 [Gigantopelta aegis]